MKSRGCLYRIAQLVLVLVILAGALVYFGFLLPFWGTGFNHARRVAKVPVTPPWALECWLWEDDVNTSAEVLRLLNGYEEHDFPVRTILIDSPWSTRYNDFIVDEARYPNPQQFFTDLQDRGYRVVLWMTNMVDSQSKDTAIPDSQDWFDDARSKGYLAGDGIEVRWWKGQGGFIDYTNPEAMKWWRGLQQNVFDWGLDGWKLDGAATFFGMRWGQVPIPYQKAHEGWMTTRGYMDHYYRDEYQHGLTQNPEFITLARSLDRGFHPEGFAPLDAAPVCWVGDQDHEWTLEKEGLEEALTDILASAELGYGVIGSDIGGYSGGEIPPELYIRWAQFSTFCGLFLNGGHGQRAMWERTPEELAIIRKFAWLHTELVPYIYSNIVAQHEGGPTLMRPTGGKYEYLFGDAFFVAPIFEPGNTRTVNLPAGRWRYLFADGEVIEGPKTFTRDYPIDEAPVYIREGAIVPMRISRDYTGFGDVLSASYTTIVIYPDGERSFDYADPGGEFRTTVKVSDGETVQVSFDNPLGAHILRVHSPKAPSAVMWNGEAVGDWSYDQSKSVILVRSGAKEAGGYTLKLAS